ncbi:MULTISPECIES: hypothetical protein [Massilia]|uniref:Uncharacterized protein n=1 Tax=Massilia haematophila TaxID=457923 RepID=A0ABV7PKM4_9BURK|nr:hypothetical protein [Massilia sp.]
MLRTTGKRLPLALLIVSIHLLVAVLMARRAAFDPTPAGSASAAAPTMLVLLTQPRAAPPPPRPAVADAAQRTRKPIRQREAGRLPRGRAVAVAVPVREAEGPAEAAPDQAAQADEAAVPHSPLFDRDAALRMAREVASQPDAFARQHPARLRSRELTPTEKLGREIDRSTRSDCRTAYAGAGPLAIIMLAKDAISDKGCKW